MASIKIRKKNHDPIAKNQLIQENKIRDFFKKMDFKRIASGGIEIEFEARTGEIDDIFIYENVMILAEYTVGRHTTDHLTKKSILNNLINENQSKWIEFCLNAYDKFKGLFKGQDYAVSEYNVHIIYFSPRTVSSEISSSYSYIKFLNETIFRYFDALAKTIHKSARYEFFKFLGLNFSDVGSEVKKTSNDSKSFTGYVLPENLSCFPKEFKVVSFYADPSTLLVMSYVLRRDSWRDEEGMYQRVLQGDRMGQMRKYLTTEERVFVNNIIVTLPTETKLNDANDPSKNIDTKKVQNVNVCVPFKSDVIGIVDGQHRVFCYHEGEDKYEAKIKDLRCRQNLLVTGIIYPLNYTESSKRRFEAKLFLEINDRQRKTNSALKQSIELLLNPYSTIAIAKSIIQKLNLSGPLKEMLQTNYFDPPNLIKTSSIVGYGLKPLLKLEGNDSLFFVWDEANKVKLKDLQLDPSESTDPILDVYVSYCVKLINNILIAAKKVVGSEAWKAISPTMINGFFHCLRLLVENKKIGTIESYEASFAKLYKFDFSSYKSSRWSALGKALYEDFFKD